jgi:hypothetical protein
MTEQPNTWKPRRHKANPGECKFCDQMREEGREWHPAHDASRNCQSGQRAHCSCDTCF